MVEGGIRWHRDVKHVWPKKIAHQENIRRWQRYFKHLWSKKMAHREYVTSWYRAFGDIKDPGGLEFPSVKTTRLPNNNNCAQLNL